MKQISPICGRNTRERQPLRARDSENCVSGQRG